MHVLLIKQPRKPLRVVVVEKNRLDYARDIQSTMQVLKPKWKCDLLKAEKIGSSDAIPASIVTQAVVNPLSPTDPLEEAILSLL